jgi:DNA-binding NarL/FixJ family response regulator
MIRVLLADEQDIFLQGLTALLSIQKDLSIAGQARNGKEAIALTHQLQPDVILMDVQLQILDGVAVTREIHTLYPWIKIIILTTLDADDSIRDALEAGAVSYLLKRTPAEQIEIAIRSAYLGYSQLDSEIIAKIFAKVPAKLFMPKANYTDLLNSSEIEILTLIGQGNNNQEIAQKLHLSPGTVRNYVTRIFNQFNFRDRIQAALWAHEHLNPQ